MLADHTPIANIACSDLDRSRGFYEGTLGFKPIREIPQAGAIVYEGGSGTFLLYSSQFAGTNKATSMGFELSLADFDDEIARLRADGIAFDAFELPGIDWDEGVASMGEGKAVWFRDPDGNIISVTGGTMG